MSQYVMYSILVNIVFYCLLLTFLSCNKDESSDTGTDDSISIKESRKDHQHSEAYEKAKKSFKNGKYENALEQFKELSKKDKGALSGVGLSYYMLDDYLNAAIFLEEALTYKNDDFICQKFLAFSYYYINETHKSLFHAEKALALRDNKELSDLHTKLIQQSRANFRTKTFKAAQKLFDNRDYKGALLLYKEAAQKDKSALVGVGASHYMLGDYIKAIIVLEESITYNSRNFEAQKFLAFAYEKVNEPQKSLSHLHVALSVKHDKELQNLYERLNNTNSYDKQLHTQPQKIQWGTSKKEWEEATKRFRQGDYESAVHLYKKIARTDKNAYAFAGLSYFKLKNYERAIDYLKKAVKHNSNDFLALKLLAFSYNETQDISKSLLYAQKAIALKKDYQLQLLYDRLKKDQTTWDNYTKSETIHFTLLYDDDVHRDARRKITDILEDAYGTIGRQLNYFPSQKIIVILYTRKKFSDVTHAPGWVSALYDGKIRVPVKGIQGRHNILERILFHEYSHALIHSITSECPLWMNEGLAEYFSKKSPRKIGQVIPLRHLEKSFMALERRKVSDAYLESYSAVSDLIDQYGLYRMKKLLFAFSRTSNYNEAFSSTLSLSYDEFVSQWGRG
jgi:tetratricopeptide (TPR) repeat protein